MAKGAKLVGRVGLAGRACTGVVATMAVAVAMTAMACRVERGTTPPDRVENGEGSGATAAGGTDARAGGRAFASYEPGKPGPAYFAVRHEGIVMLDGGELTKVDGGPTEHVREISRGADGGMYLLGSEGVMRLDGAKAEPVAALGPVTGELVGFAVAKDGTIWGVGDGGVSRWDGAAWKTEAKAVLGPDVPRIRGVVVDGRGRVWVVSAHAIHLREADRWVTVDVSRQVEGRPVFEGVGLGPGGVALAMSTHRLVELHAPDGLETIKVGANDPFLGELGSSATGIIAVRVSADVVTRVMPDGAQTQWSARRDFASSLIEDVTPDDAGRLWVATDTGVAILGPGDEKVEWRSGSVDELVGVVDVIGVAGTGPVLPTDVGPVKKGGLAGRIVRRGKGFARATLEVCPSPSVIFTRTPCADAPTRFSVRTDADGRFAIADVPLGAYGLAVQMGKRWQLGEAAKHRVSKEGEVYDIGQMVLQEEK
jgi:hypothetical protein